MRRTQPAQSLPVQPKDELSPRRMGESRSGFLEAESSNARKGSGKERRKAQTVITNYPTLAAARDEGGDFDCVSGSLVWVGNSRVGRTFLFDAFDLCWRIPDGCSCRTPRAQPWPVENFVEPLRHPQLPLNPSSSAEY